jgi:NAD-dependent dihydropyrimidine dehydrogenase PreA subunit
MEERRACYRCHELKPVDDFAWRRREKGQRDSFCRPCRSAYGKEHYAANRQRYIDQAAVVTRRRRLERTHYLLEFFESHPCVDCGETDPVVLEFDHVGEKSFNIGSVLSNLKWETILAEIEKCEVVCANCHRRRTARRRGALRAVLTEGRT